MSILFYDTVWGFYSAIIWNLIIFVFRYIFPHLVLEVVIEKFYLFHGLYWFLSYKRILTRCEFFSLTAVLEVIDTRSWLWVNHAEDYVAAFLLFFYNVFHLSLKSSGRAPISQDRMLILFLLSVYIHWSYHSSKSSNVMELSTMYLSSSISMV